MTLLSRDFTSDWAQDMSTLDRLHGDLKPLQQSLATEDVAECCTKFHGRASKFWCNLRVARDTQDLPLEHLQQFQPQLKEFDLVYPQLTIPRDPCRVGHDLACARCAEHKDALSSGTANIFGRLSFRHAGQRHGRLHDEVHSVRECGGRSEERFAEERGGVDAAHHSVHSVDGGG